MRFLICFSVSSFLFAQAFAQSAPSAQSSTVGDDFCLFLKLTGHTFTAPTRWNGCDWLTAGGVLAATGGASLLDNDGFNLMARNQTKFNMDVSNVIVKYGSGITGLAVTGAMYIGGLAFENKWLRETSVLMASALSVSVAAELTLKLVVGRARPYTGLGNSTFKPFNGAAFRSFPSGHTVVAFTLSAVLSERIKNTWASVGLYSLATLVAASRMYTRDHWLSDVVFAGALSTFVARSVVHCYENGMREDEVGLHIIPQTNGVMVVWRF